ncbi:MAG: FAD-binding oxidoreductase [Chloroflexota bacterium]|nr:FAD-binding oxidoreductase [Chloroflexota bacterium]MDE2898814.1 FAD-binding oxidoreductase [Chloroflexota bacterium]
MSADVVVIGAGVSGLSSAYFLARAGRDVVVVDKGIVGGEASGRNGGMVSERVDEPLLIPMAVEATELWTTLDEELGYPTEFTQEGRLQVAVTELEMGDLLAERDVALRHGIDVALVEPSEIRDMIPGITERTLGGLFFPNGGHANTQLTVQAYAWALQDLGGRLYQNTTVTGLRVIDGRVSVVETTAGDFAPEIVIGAAGPQTGLLADLADVHVPVAPARVEILATAPVEQRFPIALVGNGLYGHQAVRGNLIFGGGAHEWADVELTASPGKPNTPLIRNIARRVAELLPGMADVPVIRSWAGVVEQAPDYRPIIDILDCPSNYVVVTASAHGFGISPATGKVVSELVLHGEASIDISGLGLSRFADYGPDWREQRGWTPAPLRF